MSQQPIRLGQFLKFTGLAETGVDAREMVVNGWVQVDGEVETRRGRQLAPGTEVTVTLPDGQSMTETVQG